MTCYRTLLITVAVLFGAFALACGGGNSSPEPSLVDPDLSCLINGQEAMLEVGGDLEVDSISSGFVFLKALDEGSKVRFIGSESHHLNFQMEWDDGAARVEWIDPVLGIIARITSNVCLDDGSGYTVATINVDDYCDNVNDWGRSISDRIAADGLEAPCGEIATETTVSTAEVESTPPDLDPSCVRIFGSFDIEGKQKVVEFSPGFVLLQPVIKDPDLVQVVLAELHLLNFRMEWENGENSVDWIEPVKDMIATVGTIVCRDDGSGYTVMTIDVDDYCANINGWGASLAGRIAIDGLPAPCLPVF